MKSNQGKITRFHRLLLATLIFIVFINVCKNTAYYDRSIPYSVVATIPTSQISETATSDEIFGKLLNIWMGKYRIGTLGWLDWVWTYKIQLRHELEQLLDQCVFFEIRVITVFPWMITEWYGLYATIDGIWIKDYYTMLLSEEGGYYKLSGPFSLC
ncbi:MAG: hypothetical protein KF758_06740 [Anaerolineales bacterium]|nr:hypothetical protein [Anaerolineales bacterium]MBX3036591.1 hypothetical protein [Anaerolineales bacterium]